MPSPRMLNPQAISRLLLTTVFLVFLLVPAAHALTDAEAVTYTDSWGTQGLSMDRQDSGRLVLNFSLTNWSIGQTAINGRQANVVQIPGTMLPNEAGAPDLPGISQYVAVPNGATVSVRLLEARTETYYGVDLAPAPIIPLDTDKGPLVFAPDFEIYAKDEFYPAEPLLVGDMAPIRGVSAAMLGVTPFQYNPVSQELVVYRDIRLEVVFSGGNGSFGEDRLRSPWFDPILNDIFINGTSLQPVMNPAGGAEEVGQRTPDFEYVIISPPLETYLAWADTLRRFRSEQGISTGVFSTADIGGNTTAAIESFINDAYNNWDVPPVAVLLLGDHGTAPTDVVSPIYDSYCVSDNIYADVSGNHLPDLILARMTADNPTNLETYVRKILDYENNPPTNPDFYAKPVIAGGWQTERWFVLCDEVVYGFMANELGKEPTREYAIYDGTPNVWSTATNTQAVLDYFGPSGLGYIPATPAHLNDWGGNATRLNADINAGTFMVQHRDHGGEDGWGEPDYRQTDLAGLHNEDLTFVFSINCLTGKYNHGSECFAETFHRHQQGALGIIAASEVSYSFVNDAYVWGLFDNIWPDFDPGHGIPGEHKFLPAFANASGKYFLQASSWPYNSDMKELTFHLFHHHGDAFSTVLTEVPNQLTVSHEGSLISGLEFFNVTADEGALIGLSVNGQLLSSAISQGGQTSLAIESQLPGQDLVITVTKQNHYRHQTTVPIIPPEGSFVVFNDVVIDDSEGDGNGNLDFAETATLSLDLHNVGLETALGVSAVISSEDPYVTILDDSETYGDIAADGFLTVADGYQVSLSETVPDGHVIPFTVVATDADSFYTSGFSLIGHAPVVAIDHYVITGDEDQDGILDPGETATMTVTLGNFGSATVRNLDLDLVSLNPNVVLVPNTPMLRDLVPDGTAELSWELSAHADTPIGEVAEFEITADCDNYTYSEMFALSVGLQIDDFESGAFLTYPWEMAGNADWSTTTAAPFEGEYCAQSGDITDNQTTDLMVEASVLTPGNITFQVKVDSESGWDYLHFYIDQTEMASWSGSVGWTEVSYPVDVGNHTFKWSYTKDTSVSTGADCGWIDYIVFPAMGEPLRPTCEIDPENFTETLDKPDSSVQMLNIANTGEGELDFQVAVSLGETPQTAVPFRKFKKDEADLRSGSEISRGSGGPDAFGYSWIDSDEPGGPVYFWEEINSVGTVAGSGDDANLGPFDLGFDFTYYGVAYDQVRICTNGWISFTSTNTSYSNQGIPNSSEPNNLIALLWDDLNPNTGGTIYYYAEPGGQRFIVEYDGVPHYGSSDTVTCQVILNADGSILCQYKEVQDVGGCTVGIENGAGNDGLEVAFNNASYLQDELAILYSAVPPLEPWLSVSPRNGVVAPGSFADLEVTFNSVDVDAGDFNGMVTVHTNDPANPVIEIPATLTVTDGVSATPDGALPKAYALNSAHPNPFNPVTNLQFAVPRSGKVSLKIYDLAGRHVRTLIDGHKTAGYHSEMWDGTDHKGHTVASGAYYYRLQASGFEQTRKMMLLK